MILTMRDVMTLSSLQSGVVIAGKNGLDRKVSKVSVLEIPFNTDETFSQPLTKDSCELVISALYSVVNNPSAQLKIIQNLNACGCSGLILCYVGTWLKTVSEELIALANQLDFPIISLPEDVLYSDIITEVMEKVLSLQNEEIRYAYDIHNEMTRSILQSRDARPLLKILQSKLNHNVMLYTTEGHYVSINTNPFSQDKLEKLSELIQCYIPYFASDSGSHHDESDLTEHYKVTQLEGQKLCLAPIFIFSVYYGTIVILDAQSFNNNELIALDQAKNSFALIAANQIKLRQLNFTRQKAYLHDLLYGNFASNTAAIASGQSVDIKADQLHIILSVDLRKPLLTQEPTPSVNELVLYKKIYRGLRAELSSADVYRVSYKRHNEIIVMVDCVENDRGKTLSYAQQLAGHLHQYIDRNYSRSVYIGISNYFESPIDIEAASKEAASLVSFARRTQSEQKILFYRDYGFLCKLDSLFMNSKAELQSFVQQMFAPIITYDKQNSTELYTTFCTLIKNENVTQITADELFIHKNTLLQRKHKIVSLLSVDPFTPPFSLQYQIAYLLMQLYSDTLPLGDDVKEDY